MIVDQVVHIVRMDYIQKHIPLDFAMLRKEEFHAEAKVAEKLYQLQVRCDKMMETIDPELSEWRKLARYHSEELDKRTAEHENLLMDEAKKFCMKDKKTIDQKAWNSCCENIRQDFAQHFQRRCDWLSSDYQGYYLSKLDDGSASPQTLQDSMWWLDHRNTTDQNNYYGIPLVLTSILSQTNIYRLQERIKDLINIQKREEKPKLLFKDEMDKWMMRQFVINKIEKELGNDITPAQKIRLFESVMKFRGLYQLESFDRLGANVTLLDLSQLSPEVKQPFMVLSGLSFDSLKWKGADLESFCDEVDQAAERALEAHGINWALHSSKPVPDGERNLRAFYRSPISESEEPDRASSTIAHLQHVSL